MLFSSVHDCQLMTLPKITNASGNLTAINGLIDIPFEIKRVYYLYDVPGGESRGGHAHRTLNQLVVKVPDDAQTGPLVISYAGTDSASMQTDDTLKVALPVATALRLLSIWTWVLTTRFPWVRISSSACSSTGSTC